MKIEAFKEVVFLIKKHEKKSNKLYKLGIDVYSMGDYLFEAMSIMLKSHYSEIGYDYISWWLWENVEKKVYLEDGSEIDLTDIKDLWLYVEDIRKSPDYKEYTPKTKKKLNKKQMEKKFDDIFGK